MTNSASSSAIKENLLRIFKQLPPKIIIGVGVLLMLGVCWSLLIQPLQQTLELAHLDDCYELVEELRSAFGKLGF